MKPKPPSDLGKALADQILSTFPRESLVARQGRCELMAIRRPKSVNRLIELLRRLSE